MSVVRIGLAPRANGTSRSAAQRKWRAEHARLFSRLPGLISYVQNHAILDHDDEPILGDPGFDIFAEVEYETAAELEQVSNSSYYREAILADEKGLLDPSRRTFLMTRRRPLAGTPREGACKLALFLAGERINGLAEERHLDSVRIRTPSPECSMGYVVESVGGAIPRAIDLLIQHYYSSIEEAVEAHRGAQVRWEKSARDGFVLQAAVLVREVEIVPRPLPDPARRP